MRALQCFRWHVLPCRLLHAENILGVQVSNVVRPSVPGGLYLAHRWLEASHHHRGGQLGLRRFKRIRVEGAGGGPNDRNQLPCKRWSTVQLQRDEQDCGRTSCTGGDSICIGRIGCAARDFFRGQSLPLQWRMVSVCASVNHQTSRRSGLSGRLLLPRRDVRQAAVPGKYHVRRRKRDVCVRPGLRWRQCHGLCCVWGWQVCSNAGMLDRQRTCTVRQRL